MSYILEALRKSEAERRQGQAPDLGQPLQMIYKPRRKPVPIALWLILALMLNAGVLGYVFWPEIHANLAPASSQQVRTETVSPSPEAETVEAGADASVSALTEQPSVSDMPTVQPGPQLMTAPETEQPTIIVPRPVAETGELTPTRPQGRVPHLVELPLSFQKSIPDLTFNSHIVSSNPLASSLMINNQYLRVGDRLDDMLVERINEDSVVFSLGGQPFRIGTTRNWMSPR